MAWTFAQREKGGVNSRLDLVDLQHLVAIVVDDLHGDLAGLGRIERVAASCVKGSPRGFVDLGAEGLL